MPCPRPSGSTRSSRSRAVPGEPSSRTHITEPTGRPFSSAIQTRSRYGSWSSAKSATIRATRPSKSVFQPYSAA